MLFFIKFYFIILYKINDLVFLILKYIYSIYQQVFIIILYKINSLIFLILRFILNICLKKLLI